jgi:hypothetical protein
MRAPFFVICLLAAAIGGAAAQTPIATEKSATVTGITVTNAGAFTGDSTSAPAHAGQQSPTNTVGSETNWHFVSTGADVAGKVGTQFGVEFRIDGTPPGDGVTLYLVLMFPPQGMRNPNTGDRFRTARIAFPNMKIGALSVLGYGFDNDWEIVPGVWTEQIWYQNRMLAERTFTVGRAE